MKLVTACALLMAFMSVACAPKMIPGLDIELADTPDHRALVEVADAYRLAYEKMDIASLVDLASERFYEDAGTPETEDDYNYQGLTEHFSAHFKVIKKLQLNMSLKAIKVEGDQATIDYRYVTRYLMALPAGDKWQVTDEINRMELVREEKTWKVISGF